MKIHKHLKKAAAAASGILIFSAAANVNSAVVAEEFDTETYIYDDYTEETSEFAGYAEDIEESKEEETAVSYWYKAEIGDYDSSLSLISYELSIPEPNLPEYEKTDEEKAEDEEAVRNGIKNVLSSVVSKKAAEAKYTGPTPVEYIGTGAVVGEIPGSQDNPYIDAQPGEFAFVTYGWGHGVGMSQNGANFYATYSGWNYQDILFHYYPDTYLMNTGLTDIEELTIGGAPAGDTLEVVSSIVFREVGASMNYEAIKAQAVAVYTYIKYNGDDSADLRGKADPPQIVIDACSEVLGEALYYGDSYALTMFSASSGGCTANCYDVFYADLPYLRSVQSDYDAAYDPHYGTVTYYPASEVKRLVEASYGIVLSDDPANWIQPIYSEQTGYVTDVVLDGQITVRGYDLKLKLGLKSSKFNVTYQY